MKKILILLIPLFTLALTLCCQAEQPPEAAVAQPPARTPQPTRTPVPAQTATARPKPPPVNDPTRVPTLNLCIPWQTPTPTSSPTPFEEPWQCRPGTLDQRINSAGQARTYRLHVPPVFDANMPLVVALHGTGGLSEWMEQATGLSGLADRYRFIAVYPQALGGGENAAWSLEPVENGDMTFMRDLLDTLEAHCQVNPRRIYVTGMSNGGGMTNRMACDMPERIAAIAPVAGAYSYSGICTVTHPMPVLAIHGDADEIVLYEGTGAPENLNDTAASWPPVYYWAATWALRDRCNSRPAVETPRQGVTRETWQEECREGVQVILYTLHGGGHIWPDWASQTIWEFLKKWELSS